MSKVALVTGTSSGIGLATAVLLAQSGYTVVATLRDPARADALRSEAQAAKVKLDIRQMDVQDDASVASCVQSVLGEYGQIDLLVNNAGSGYLGSMEQTSMAALHDVMDVNFFGVWRVTQAVLPAMREARAGRVISISSIGGLVGHPFNDAYCAAKFAVEGFMESLAPVAARLGISVSLIEPGPVNTEFVKSVSARAAAVAPAVAASASAYKPMLDAYLEGSKAAFATLGQTAGDVARVILEAATADKPHLRYATSDAMKAMIGRKYVDPTGDSVLAMTGARLP